MARFIIFGNCDKSSKKKGHIFKSLGDSEVIGHLYEEFGSNFVQKLNGMFAIALWDSKKEKLLLIRDRLGIKSFHYSVIGKKIIFSSEIKAILKYPNFKKEVDFSALDFYFSYQGCPFPRTIFSGIRLLSAGSLLVAQKGKIAEKQYWSVFAERKPYKYSLKEAKIRFLELLKQSIERHFVSEVPLGLFLSGGVDSGGLLALARHLFPLKKIQTFTLGFKIKNNFLANQTDFITAWRLARLFKADHHELILTSSDFIGKINEIFDVLDWPFSISPPVFFLAEKAKHYVKTVICGDGSDELSGGYRYHKFFPDDIISVDRSFGLTAPFSGEDKKKLYASTSLVRHRDDFYNFLKNHTYNLRIKDPLNKILSLDLVIRLPNYNLIPLDHLSMYHAVEMRFPYLDDLLVDFLLKLPGRMKIRDGVGKFLLKEILKDFLPANILNLEKTAFAIPKHKWLFSLEKNIKSVLTVRRLKKHGFLNESHVQELLGGGRTLFNKLPRRTLSQLWSIFCFQIWWEKHFG